MPIATNLIERSKTKNLNVVQIKNHRLLRGDTTPGFSKIQFFFLLFLTAIVIKNQCAKGFFYVLFRFRDISL